jgi:uncharacterized protein (TIGR02099 family)
LYSYNGQGGFVVRLVYLLLTVFFHVAIFAVALVGLANFWFPLVGDYKGLLEQEMSSFLGNQVSIGLIRVDRNSESPRWIIQDLQLVEPSGEVPIHIRQLALTLDWRESLRTLRLQPAEIQLEGVEFTLNQGKQDLPDVQGLRFPLPGQKNTVLDIERKSPMRVMIDGGSVHWVDTVNHRSLTLHDLQFFGEIAPDTITLQTDALFPQDIGETLGVDAALTRVKMPDGTDDWSGKLNTRTRIFNLAALPSPRLQQWGVNAGSLHLDTQIQVEPGKPLQIQGEGEITHLGLRGTQQIPALQGIQATFKADNTSGQVQLKLQDGSLKYPQWFETDLPIDKLDASLNWQVKEDGWYWNLSDLNVMNRDIKASGVGTLALPTGKAPDLDLNMSFATQRRVDNVRDYIPSVIVDGTEEWLKTAIVAGYVPKGEFVLKGNPADFPFTGKKKGVFDIRFDIEQGILAYLPEWPEAHDVSGELRFHNAGMSARVNSARIMDLAVKGGTVDIPDMLNETHLLLDLQTKGDLQAHMNYLQTAPIGRNLRDFMKVAKFSGDSELNLKLDVPLDAPVLEKKGVKVDGQVTLHDNHFSIPEYGQVFSKLNGLVYFDQFGVRVPKAQGEYKQQAVQITADTDKAKNRINVNISQHNAPQAFLPESLSGLANYMHGDADLEARLELPAFNFSAGESKASLKLHAKSSLQGVEIKLPEPLAKPAGQARELTVDLDIPFDSSIPWKAAVAMEKLLAVQARLPHKSQEKTAIGISLGSQPVALPTEGVAVGGKLAKVDLLALSSLGLSGGGSGHASPVPVTADVDIGDLRLGQQSLGPASLKASSADIVQAHIHAPKVQANLYLPLRAVGQGRVNIDLQGIDLEALAGQSIKPDKAAKSATLSPVDFPSMRVTCQDCRKGDFPIQQLILAMNKRGKELQIEKLDIRNPLLSLSANQGRWFMAQDGHSYTELNATAHIPELGKLLAEQGSEAGFTGGELDAEAQLRWEGAPFAFSLAGLGGTAHVKLGKGNLTEVEPGVGRLLGLLDIQRLSSRLSMDFRDMTGKGVAFDEIQGNFRLDHGVLYTNDTVLKAAALIAGIKGSTDLVRKTHDQTVTIIPNLRSTLPVVGAVVGGVGGGVIALLFNEMTDKSAEDKLKTSGGFRYRVTGDWVKPDVSELKTPPRAADVDVFAH